MPPSAIADALRKVGGNVEQAADLLFKAAQARPACTVGTRRASPTDSRAAVWCRHSHVRASAHVVRRARMSSTQAVVPSVAALRRAARPAFAPLAAHAPADARRRRVSHRAPALRPHLAHQIAMRIQRAHNLERFFSTFSDPQNLGGGRPSPGFAALPFALVWQAEEKAAEEATQVRSHTLNVFSLHRNASSTYARGTPYCFAVACTHAV